jgi:peptide deformylase
MNLVLYPDPRLLVPCKAVDRVTPELADVAKEMIAIMLANGGVGLASTQVGLDIRLIVLKHGSDVITMFNPSIRELTGGVEYEFEGCLSFPNVSRYIKRHKVAKVKYRDEHNKMQYVVLTGIEARCVQHETDHLNGVLFNKYEEKL